MYTRRRLRRVIKELARPGIAQVGILRDQEVYRAAAAQLLRQNNSAGCTFFQLGKILPTRREGQLIAPGTGQRANANKNTLGVKSSEAVAAPSSKPASGIVNKPKMSALIPDSVARKLAEKRKGEPEKQKAKKQKLVAGSDSESDDGEKLLCYRVLPLSPF